MVPTIHFVIDTGNGEYLPLCYGVTQANELFEQYLRRVGIIPKVNSSYRGNSLPMLPG